MSTTTAPEAGFSLIELLVAVAVSIMMLTGAVAIFHSSRSAYSRINRSYEVHEIAYVAFTNLKSALRGAGFFGCSANVETYSSVVDNDGIAWTLKDPPIRGYSSKEVEPWAVGLSEQIPANIDPDSDVLVVTGPERNADTLQLTRAMTDPAASLLVSNPESISVKPGDTAIAYTCEAASIFRVTSFEHGEIQHAGSADASVLANNSTDSLGYAYPAGTEILPIERLTFYVAANGAGTRSLWKKKGARAAQEIARDVTRLNLKYGMDQRVAGSQTTYLSANSVADWSTVNSVAITLSIRPSDTQKDTVLTDVVQLRNSRASR